MIEEEINGETVRIEIPNPPLPYKRGRLGGVQMLMEKDPQYRQKELDLEAKALQSIDIKFDRADYKRTHDRFEKEKKENPDIPTTAPSGALEPPTTPTSGMPKSAPAKPATPAPAAGKK